ncbi:hypothetical protein Q75_01530 [Bacillus coahuilensis p1.1.43]|uniref:DUF5658 domain-containing protein n=1 Tax=Bacillus coahuilensis p1.1.43 TaxID=1150625 RepID=A0A147KC72_9BACI|nr:DUF5658 family protein [Bacillus coahuilensis]KUP09142.1 hypothetical protein Q75_01530 [Bacillus coahuilensis p1.1.43]
MKGCFVLIGGLNLLDGFLTFIGLEENHITEANPLMKDLYMFNPLLFLACKLTLSLCILAIVPFIPESPRLLVQYLGKFTMAAYLFICLLHLAWIVPPFLI